MALSRFGINLAFACIAAALVLTASAALYVNRDEPDARHAETPVQPAASMPRDHPPIDAEQRLAALEQMSTREPQNPDFQAQVANLYFDLARYETAAAFYERSLRLRPGDPAVETDLAVCYHNLGRHDQALETLGRVLQYKPGFVQAMYNKGVVLIHGKKDVAGAAAAWEDLLRTHPEYPQRAELERRIRELKASGN